MQLPLPLHYTPMQPPLPGFSIFHGGLELRGTSIPGIAVDAAGGVWTCRGGGRGRRHPWRRLRARREQGRGYYRVSINATRYRVHVLVADAWLGERPTPSHEIDHINENKYDNRPCNLRYLTPEAHIAKATISDSEWEDILDV